MQLLANQKLYQYYRYLLISKNTLSSKRRKHYSHFSKIKRNFYKELWSNAARNLSAEFQDYHYGFFKIQFGRKSTYIFGSEVMLDNHLTLKIAGNKPLIYRILSEQYYPVAKYVEFNLASIKKADAFLKRTGKAVVVKPADSGSAGHGITTGIDTWISLKKASFRAAIYSPQLMVEEQVEGNSFRLLFLNGQYLDAIERNPPSIVGDGVNSIKELINRENIKRVQSEEIISLHTLTIDFELKMCLYSQGYRLNNVIPKNKTIHVKNVVNQNSCIDNISVKELVHPKIIEMGSHITKLLGVKLAGIDIICKDITKPLHETNGIINEVNTTPGLHHHYLISNKTKVTPVAQYILEFLKSTSICN